MKKKKTSVLFNLIAGKKIWVTCAMLALLGFFVSVPVGGAPGTASDPVVSLSYLQQVYTPSLLATTREQANAAFGSKSGILFTQLEALYKKGLLKVDRDALAADVTARVLQKLEQEGKTYRSAAAPTTLTLKLGDVLLGTAGCTVTLTSGQAKVQPSGNVGNLTLGYQLSAGMTVLPGQKLIMYEDNTGIGASYDAVVTVTGRYRVISYLPKYEDLANALNSVDLFRGTPQGYELNRPATRLEALVMMIRLLGEEQAALAYTGNCPFTDVPNWGRPYVAYAFSKGYTKGVSSTLFDMDSSVTPPQYITFVLRALGYSDTDFQWDRAPDFAVQAGLYSQNEITLTHTPFYRDQVVYLSYYALEGRGKNGVALLDKLIDAGAIDRTAAQNAIAQVTRVRP